MTSSRENLQKAIRQMDNMNLQNVGGVNYVTYELTPNIEKHLQMTSQVEVRDDDIITVGFPRSGNHWTFEVVNMILHQNTNFAEDVFYSCILDTMGDNIHETVGKMVSPRLLASHNRIQRIPLQAIEKKTKIIYIMRNPKDCLVSLYKLMTGLKIDSNVYNGTWNDFFELQISGNFPWGSWFDHVLATEAFMKKHPYCPVYILVFEEMKQDPIAAVSKLCHFLGKPDAIAEQIASVTKFSNMKKVLLGGKMNCEETKNFKDDSEGIFPKGEIGNWKNWFTVAQSEIFNREFEKKMAGSKLAGLVRDYI